MPTHHQRPREIAGLLVGHNGQARAPRSVGMCSQRQAATARAPRSDFVGKPKRGLVPGCLGELGGGIWHSSSVWYGVLATDTVLSNPPALQTSHLRHSSRARSPQSTSEALWTCTRGEACRMGGWVNDRSRKRTGGRSTDHTSSLREVPVRCPGPDVRVAVSGIHRCLVGRYRRSRNAYVARLAAPLSLIPGSPHSGDVQMRGTTQQQC